MKLRKYNHIILPILLGITLILVWTVAESKGILSEWIVPNPGDIVKVFLNHYTLVYQHTITTLKETILGLVLSLFIGIIFAICMDRWSSFKKMLYPYMILTQTIPIISVAPLIILWLGYGIQAKIFIVALVCFFPISVSLYDGFQNVSIEHIRLFKSMRANAWQTFYLLKIPSALPSFFTGLKLSASYSVMAAVIGEWLGGESGLGIYMTRAVKSYQTAHVFAIIIVIAALSIFLYGIVIFFERFMLKWRFCKQAEYLEPE